MEAKAAAKTVEVLVNLKVTVALAAGAAGLAITDYFEHEIRDALTPSIALCNTLLDDAGLPLEVLEIGPS